MKLVEIEKSFGGGVLWQLKPNCNGIPRCRELGEQSQGIESRRHM